MRRSACGRLLVVLVVSVLIRPATGTTPAHFHHVHVNATNPAKTQEFYEKTFGAQPIRFKGTVDGLFTSRGFILINKVDATPRDIETTSIRHIGWRASTGPANLPVQGAGAVPHAVYTAWAELVLLHMFGPDREIGGLHGAIRNHLFNYVHYSVEDARRPLTGMSGTLGMTLPASAKGLRPTDPAARWGTSARLTASACVDLQGSLLR